MYPRGAATNGRRVPTDDGSLHGLEGAGER